jgi:hypothetical protein
MKHAALWNYAMNDRGKRTKNVSRQHHFVPRWYLQHWSRSSDERVLRAKKTPTGILFDAQLPNNIGREKDLNTVFGSPGNPGRNFEDQVTRILDDPFSALHRKMITEGLEKFTDAERFELARHLCALQVRNPHIIRDQLEPAMARPVTFPSYLSPKELGEMKEFEPRYRKRFNSNYDFTKFIAQAMLHNLDKDAEALVPKTWVVLPSPPEKNLLITGELPFIATQGFASPKSNYIFPATPSLALVLTDDLESLLRTMDLDKLWGFAHLNFCIVINNREVYFRNPGHKKFIERFLGRRDSLPKDPAEHQRAVTQLAGDFLLSIRQYFIDLGLDVPPQSTP